jgi:hypothetical protein
MRRWAMKAKPLSFITIFAVLALTSFNFPLHGWMISGPATASVGATLAVAPQPAAMDSPQVRVTEALHSSPVMFIENVGQFADGVRFQVRGSDKTIWLAEDAIWVTVLEKPSSPYPLYPSLGEGGALSPSPKPGRGARGENRSHKGVNLKLSFPGANPHPRLEPFDRLDTVVSYFIGNDPAKWRANVPVWGGVRYVDLYPGIDLEISSEGGRLVQRLVTQPWADLSLVRLRVEGADAVTLEGNKLRLTTAIGEFFLPLIIIESNENLKGQEPVVELVGAQNFDVIRPFATVNPESQSAPLIAQSSDLFYASFLGGGDEEWGAEIAVDGSGATYVTGQTFSPDFSPTYQGNGDAFVAKVNPLGSALVYVIFLGGSDEDWGGDIAVDASGAAYITGGTYSVDFPNLRAFDPTYNGGCDVFIVKVNPYGSALVYASFLGGSNKDFGEGIAVDASGTAFITGITYSPNFPTTSGAFDPTCGTDGKCNYDGSYYYSDAFMVRVNISGSALVYASFLGGSDDDWGNENAVDASGAVYITGGTCSSDFPTPGAFDPSYNGGCDAFVAKVNPSGSALVYASFLGGSDIDWGNGITVDASGAVYITGGTYSSDFPTPGAFDPSYNGDCDAFVAKVNPSGSVLSYASFLGGWDDDLGHEIEVDASGKIYLAGGTCSPDFPTPGASNPNYNGNCDAFVAQVNPAGSTLVYATFLGGSDYDWGYGIAVGSNSAVYVTGETWSSDFPTTPGALDGTYNGWGDAFVAKLAAKPWLFAVITDLHIGYGIPDYGTEGWNDDLTGDPRWDNYYLTERVRKVVQWINDHADEYKIKFVAVLGDITDTAQRSQFKKAKELLDQLNVPYFPVIGNHDLAPYALKPGTNPDRRTPEGSQGPITSRHFREVFTDELIGSQCNKLGTRCEIGSPSPGLLNYYFDYGGVRFIVLDTSTRDPCVMIGLYSCPGVNSYAELFEDTKVFLAGALPSGKNAIIFSHHPLRYDRLRRGFNNEDLGEIEKIIRLSGATVLANFAGHTHLYATEPVHEGGVRGKIIETEAVLESSVVSETIRLAWVCMENNRPTICDFFPRSETVDANLNPYFEFHPQELSANANMEVKFEGCYKPESIGTPFSSCPSCSDPELPCPHDDYFYVWLFSDESTAHWTKDIKHTFSAPGIYTVTLTVAPKATPNLIAKVWQRIKVAPQAPIPVLMNAVSTVPVINLQAYYAGSETPTNQVPENSPQWVTLFKLSEPKPVGEFLVHFERATQDITVTLTADVDLASRKSILYAPSWPQEIEITKTLFIPSTGRGAVYICKDATSLDQVDFARADTVINLGETKDGMTVLSTVYNEREYYIVYGIAGNGAGGGEVPYFIYLPLILRNYPK